MERHTSSTRNQRFWRMAGPPSPNASSTALIFQGKSINSCLAGVQPLERKGQIVGWGRGGGSRVGRRSRLKIKIGDSRSRYAPQQEYRPVFRSHRRDSGSGPACPLRDPGMKVRDFRYCIINVNHKFRVHCQLGVRDADAIRENPSKYPSRLNVF